MPATQRLPDHVEAPTRTEWRLYSHRTTERWTNFDGVTIPGDRPDFGIPLPDGARVHSIIPNGGEWVVWFLLPVEVPE